MPCTNGGPSDREIANSSQKKILKLEAFLCAIISVLENNSKMTKIVHSQHFESIFEKISNSLDEKESGITGKQLRAWWAKHKKQDKIRRNAEKEKKLTEEARRKALNKLSDAEKKLLGLFK